MYICAQDDNGKLGVQLANRSITSPSPYRTTRAAECARVLRAIANRYVATEGASVTRERASETGIGQYMYCTRSQMTTAKEEGV